MRTTRNDHKQRTPELLAIILLILLLIGGIIATMLYKKADNENKQHEATINRLHQEAEQELAYQVKQRVRLFEELQRTKGANDSLRTAIDQLEKAIFCEREKNEQLKEKESQLKAVIDEHDAEKTEGTKGKLYEARITTKDDTTGRTSVFLPECQLADPCKNKLCLDTLACDSVGCLDEFLRDSFTLSMEVRTRKDTIQYYQVTDLKYGPKPREPITIDYLLTDPVIKRNTLWGIGHAIAGVGSHIVADIYRDKANSLGPIPEIMFDGLEPLDPENPMRELNLRGAEIKPIKEKYEKTAIGFDALGYANDAAAIGRFGRVGVRLVFGPKNLKTELAY